MTEKIPSATLRNNFLKHELHSGALLFKCSEIENTVPEFVG